ncbi:metal-sulfur cluster assembly factor [Rhodococcus globerulus]|uniref:Iron-sulfur cluster assembly protein n=1 Tax=Rhodococcus globerulus TaxID=33008 RepID=A0ABU4C3E1_RHOGO|nr:iron-sulfur cluster assembly protein [Rhodococcus globerulus]MDV6271018.1 iron-sulfur cluster assembly protein [Rhodococcus globerulus]
MSILETITVMSNPAPGFDEAIVDALRRIADPCSIATGVPINLIDMGLVLEARREENRAVVRLQLTSPICMQIGIIQAKILEEVSAVDGIEDVDVDIDHAAEWLPSMVAGHARIALRERRPFPAE